jgi:hypothetical protein
LDRTKGKTFCEINSLFLNFFLFKLIERLPDIYQDLSIFADILPGNEASPVHPFGGFVLNINVITRAHCDVEEPMSLSCSSD